MKQRCAGCNDVFREGEVRHDSGIAGAKAEHILCPMCARDEETFMEEQGGGNYVPYLLDFYDAMIERRKQS